MKKHYKKIWIFVLSLVSIAIIALGGHMLTSASEQKKAEGTAWQLVPEGSVLTQREKENGDYEFTFYHEASNASYEVTVSKKSGSAKRLEAEFHLSKGSETASLTDEEITAFLQERYPGAKILLIQLGMDDGLYSYEVSFRTDSLSGTIELNASTKDILEYTLKYGTPIVIPAEEDASQETGSLLTTDAIRELITKAYPGCTIYGLELDFDDGSYRYEADFYADQVIYEADYDAKSGELIKLEKKDTDWIPNEETKEEPSSQASSTINAEQAMQTALSKAEGTNPSIIKIELDSDDGRLLYEGEMKDSSYRYKFEIDAYTGTVLKWKKEGVKDSGSKPDSSLISAHEAQNIALEKAGASASVLSCELERDDGQLLYELELKDDFFEYEAEIDAYTGTILKWEQEPLTGH